jgi:hypothetical protein
MDTVWCASARNDCNVLNVLVQLSDGREPCGPVLIVI